MSGTAVVMGGGLAGIAAAVRLAEAGLAVTLLETRQRLGGRATSFNDPATGEDLDNCQHVLLGCCTNLIDLYRRLGVGDRIDWAHRLHFFDKRGRHDVLQCDELPAPLHLTAAMWRMNLLRLPDKLAISAAFAAMMRMRPADRARLDQISFGQWLRDHGQPQSAIDRFWDVIITSAMNLRVDRASARYAIQVFEEGFLMHRKAYVMGTSAVPLVDLYDRAVEAIERRGGEVRLSCSVERICADPETGRVTGVTTKDGDTLAADAYVAALPFDRLDKVIDPALRDADARLRSLDRFTVSPILGIHLWFAPAATDLPHMIFVDSPLQWLFNKGTADGDGEAQHVHCVISAADEWVGESAEAIIDMTIRELGAYLPAVASGRSKLVRGKVIKEKRATFAAAPGVDAIRPAASGAVDNLYLAGDWCRTGWPATMEGAVRSGYLAAADVTGQPLLAADLEPADLYGLISSRR